MAFEIFFTLKIVLILPMFVAKLLSPFQPLSRITYLVHYAQAWNDNCRFSCVLFSFLLSHGPQSWLKSIMKEHSHIWCTRDPYLSYLISLSVPQAVQNMNKLSSRHDKNYGLMRLLAAACSLKIKQGSYNIIYWLFPPGFYLCKKPKRFVILYSNQKFSFQIMIF